MVTLTLSRCCFVLKRISFACTVFFDLPDDPLSANHFPTLPEVKLPRSLPVKAPLPPVHWL